MENDRLADNIIDVIKEEQIKLGYCKEHIRLYYPLSSLNMLFHTKLNEMNMEKQLQNYFREKEDMFGRVEISYQNDRFCIHLPEQATEYVHEHTETAGFLYDFINTIAKHNVTVEEVLQQFKKYSDKVHFEKMKNADFHYLIYFEDGNPDSYRYCLTEEGHHMIYHRYTKEDYEELF